MSSALAPTTVEAAVLRSVTRRGRHLGCDTALTVVLPDGEGDADVLFDRAEELLVRLESRWSRFRPDSDISRVNRAAGHPVVVASETLDVVATALDAWRRTRGLFDPTVHDALLVAGYDRSFDELTGGTAAMRADDVEAPVVPGCVGIELDTEASTVRLPVGTALDLGGIGKGRAADLVADELLAGGALGVCVDLGGDIRVAGTAPQGGPWSVTVADPFDDDSDLARVELVAGAVATSARTRRRWRTAGGVEAHHLIDPATGRPAARGLAQVSVLAADATWAEILAKAAFVAGEPWAVELLAEIGVCGVLVTDTGRVVPTAGFDLFSREVR